MKIRKNRGPGIGLQQTIFSKIKIYPFRKLSAENFDGNQAVEQARFGGPNTKAGINDRGIVGAGIDFGLPDGSGFGYGQYFNKYF